MTHASGAIKYQSPARPGPQELDHPIVGGPGAFWVWVVGHRKDTSKEQTPAVVFDDAAGASPLGLVGDKNDSGYRNRDNQPTIVQRTMPKHRFVIVLQKNAVNAEGKYLPECHVVQYLDNESGKLIKSDANFHSGRASGRSICRRRRRRSRPMPTRRPRTSARGRFTSEGASDARQPSELGGAIFVAHSHPRTAHSLDTRTMNAKLSPVNMENRLKIWLPLAPIAAAAMLSLGADERMHRVAGARRGGACPPSRPDALACPGFAQPPFQSGNPKSADAGDVLMLRAMAAPFHTELNAVISRLEKAKSKPQP